jgi:hypothetical protein
MDFSISLAFLVLASVCLWFIIGAKGKTVSKMIMISIATLFSVCVYNSLESYKGWASQDALPEDFFVKWVLVEEPYGKDEGSIYFWIKERGEKDKTPPFFYEEDFGTPRAHSVPYSEQVHKMAQEMQKRLMQGEAVAGKNKGGKKGKGISLDGKESGEKLGSFNFSKELDIEFYTLPKGSVLTK